MAYYRCMMSGGSGDFPVTLTVTCDSAFVGETLYLTKGLTVLSKTVSATGIVEFEFPENGTWVLSNSLTSDTETFENVGEYELDLHAIPDGKTVLPVNDIQIWLKCASIFNKSYTTLGEVLADSVTLSRLMASNNAVDYMVRSTEWAETQKSLVPKMTSNTTPSGVCSASSAHSSYPAYLAFNDNVSPWVSADGTSNQYIQYQFASPVEIAEMDFKATFSIGGTEYATLSTFTVVGSTDGINFNIELGSFIDIPASVVNRLKLNKAIVRYVRVTISGQNMTYGQGNDVAKLQFYSELGIPDNQDAMSYIGLNNYASDVLLGVYNTPLVPIMTSATTPSGECIATNVNQNNYGWYAFDSDLYNIAQVGGTVIGENGYGSVGYIFPTAKEVTMLRMHVESPSYVNYPFKIAYSDNGTTWKYISRSDFITSVDGVYIFDSVGAHRYWNICFMDGLYLSSTYYMAIGFMQFYETVDWREEICNSSYFESVLNTKVPAMISNTEPEGECFRDSQQTIYQAYRSFDGDLTVGNYLWGQSYGRGRFVGYDYGKSVKLYKCTVNILGAHVSGSLTDIRYMVQEDIDGTIVDIHNKKMVRVSGGVNSVDSAIIPYPATSGKFRITSAGQSITGNDTALLVGAQFYGRQDV